MRINKYLSTAGVCSRREADRLVEQKKVMINDRIALTGDDVSDFDTVFVSGREVPKKSVNEQRVVLLYNKPVGLICSASDKDGETVFDRINYPKRLFYAGRLDKASRGLILLTNDGELSNSLMRAKNAHEREYEVRTDRAIDNEVLDAFRKGVYLKDLEKKTRPCRVKRLSDKSFSIVLTQGLNRQIRRMCESFGLHVTDLCRVRIENLTLGKLKEGTYKKISKEDYERLLATVEK